MPNEERFIELEIKFSQQEDILDTLNQTVFRQQQKIERLEAVVAELARRMVNMPDVIQHTTTEKPPHY